MNGLIYKIKEITGHNINIFVLMMFLFLIKLGKSKEVEINIYKHLNIFTWEDIRMFINIAMYMVYTQKYKNIIIIKKEDI